MKAVLLTETGAIERWEAVLWKIVFSLMEVVGW